MSTQQQCPQTDTETAAAPRKHNPLSKTLKLPALKHMTSPKLKQQKAPANSKNPSTAKQETPNEAPIAEPHPNEVAPHIEGLRTTSTLITKQSLIKLITVI
jgi:hypothetical protein